jgi:hypothetical protein
VADTPFPLGRRHAPDVRDANFPMRLMLDPLREQFFPRGLPEGTRHYRPGPRLDQGKTGTCIAHGWTGKVMGAPIMQRVPMTPYDLYRQIVQVDEWPDNDHEATAPDTGLQLGTSVRAGAKVLQRLGLISNYLWAESVEDVRAWHLAGFGGCVIGVSWSRDMFRTDPDGFISYTGQVDGGHCVYTTGWNDHVKHHGQFTRAVRFQQSWTLPWGDKGSGRAWISEADLAKLMVDDGEVCAAVEVRIAGLTP